MFAWLGMRWIRMEPKFDRGEKSGNFLQLSKDVAQFLTSQIVGHTLKDSGWKLHRNGDLTLTLSYELASQSSVQKGCRNDIAISRGHLSDSTRKPASSKFSSKKKTPSRKRRDQERFRSFLERKKQRKQRKSQQVRCPAVPVQCSPPTWCHGHFKWPPYCDIEWTPLSSSLPGSCNCPSLYLWCVFGVWRHSTFPRWIQGLPPLRQTCHWRVSSQALCSVSREGILQSCLSKAGLESHT